MRSKGSLQQPRILSFRSGSRWVRLIFLGSPQGLPGKRRTRISMGFATGKAHKRETQRKYFYLDLRKDFIKMSERGTSETRKKMPPDIFSKDFQHGF